MNSFTVKTFNSPPTPKLLVIILVYQAVYYTILYYVLSTLSIISNFLQVARTSIVIRSVRTMRPRRALIVCSLLVFIALVHGEAGHEKAEQEVDAIEHGLDRERRELTDIETNVDASATGYEEGTSLERHERSGMCRLLNVYPLHVKAFAECNLSRFCSTVLFVNRVHLHQTCSSFLWITSPVTQSFQLNLILHFRVVYSFCHISIFFAISLSFVFVPSCLRRLL